LWTWLNLDESNLSRKILFAESDIGDFQSERAASRISPSRPMLVAADCRECFTRECGSALFASCDLILPA